ncbi:MAG: hypothetical protein PUC82_00460 [bacterium]|nr:hypothetical protein [bacterium]
MKEVLNKEEFLSLLDFLYIKAVDEEKDKLGLVSKEIKKLRASFMDDSYYRFPDDRTILLVCDLLTKYGVNYEGLQRTFRSKDVAMITDIAALKMSKNFGTFMEKLYYNDDFIVGIHGSLHNGYEIENSHFFKGLLCIHGPNINRTVKFKEDGLDFYSFLRYQYYEDSDVNAIIVLIPREDINLGMWRCDDKGFYFNPKYIYGYYKSFYADGANPNPKIIRNPNFGIDKGSYDICDKWLSQAILEKKQH